MHNEEHSDHAERWVTLGRAQPLIHPSAAVRAMALHTPVIRLPVYFDEQVRSYLAAKFAAKGIDLGSAHVARVALAVEPDPLDILIFCTNAVMLHPKASADLIGELRRSGGTRGVRRCGAHGNERLTD